jgi:hypothetical protein
MISAVFCNECDLLHRLSKDDARPWRWRCSAFPLPLSFRFVAKSYAPEAPYELCERVNAYGNCNRFTPLRSVEALQP